VNENQIEIMILISQLWIANENAFGNLVRVTIQIVNYFV